MTVVRAAESLPMSPEEPLGSAAGVVIGRATTVGQALPLGTDDPVIAARAVRRALADGGRRAMDVRALVLAAPPPLTLVQARRFARRALGPAGADVPIIVVDSDESTGEALADAAVAGLTASSPRTGGVAVVVGIGRDARTIALCVDLATPRSGRT